jgi:hypothetical protein
MSPLTAARRRADRFTTLAALVLALALLLAGGCGDGDPAAPSTDAGSDADRDDDAAAAAGWGTFVVNLVAPVLGAGGRETAVAYTSVFGKVYDAPPVSAVIWTVVDEAGGCRLSTPRVPFCATSCGGSAACVADGRCAAYPRALDLGRIHVAGLGAGAFDMDQVAGNYQPGAGVALPYPPSREGDPVTISAAGGALGAWSGESRGITPLVFDETPMLSEQPLRLSWTPPGQAGLTRMEVKLDISHHGGSKGKIECDVPDTGSLEIAGTQTSRLLALGVAGFPTIVLSRVASAAVAVPGEVSLRIVSSVERAVEIAGLESCTTGSQCPAGKTCQSDLTCK